MSDYVGIVRNDMRLQRALRRLDLLFEEKDVEDTLQSGGTQGDHRLAKGFADMETPGMELDSAINIGVAPNITGFIFNEGEVSGEEV